MHQLFHLTQLNRLPMHPRLRARLALSGTVDQFADFTHHFTGAESPNFDTLLALPLYWAALDPAHAESIPTHLQGVGPGSAEAQAAVERLERAVITAIGITAILTRYMGQGRVPLEALRELWARLWFWIALIDKLCHDIDALVVEPGNKSPMKDRYEIFLAALGSIYREFAGNTPPPTSGIWVFVGRAWAKVNDHELPEAFGDVCDLLAGVPPDSIRDLALGAGGSWNALVRLVIIQIAFIVRHPVPLKHNLLKQLMSLKALLHGAAEHNPDFQSALLARDLAPALVRTAHAIQTSAASQPSALTIPLLDVYFFPAIQLLTQPPDVAVLADACRGPLVQMLLGHSLFPDERVRAAALRMILEILPQWTLYASILPKLNKSLAQANTLAPRVLRRASPEFIEAWNSFTALVTARMEVYTAFRQDDTPRMAGCAGLQCSKIGPIHEFKRCGGCFSIYYCSKACQHEDFLKGSHREDCSMWREQFEEEHQLFLPIDRRFFRALVRMDYAHHRESMYVKGLQRLVRSPSPERPGVQVALMYSGGKLNFTAPSGPEPGMALRSELERRLCQGGVEGLVAGRPVLAGGSLESTSVMLLMPIRRAAGADDVHGRLRTIADSMRADGAEEPAEKECLIAVQKLLAGPGMQEWVIC
ncbi:MYND-type domain-containing protein [Mycena indigotica]|uniref:MYND-type domain-containing protein n=1 Tax=Mycena indigotica TaxID=2126181 RepID=A0A8H6SQG1_9AGAR|nr:MYND-type domain-containing protein [Mycena indigotica]KAF7304145.1 MYND-type domain-containing protein [Mycena indigotica]